MRSGKGLLQVGQEADDQRLYLYGPGTARAYDPHKVLASMTFMPIS